VPGDGDRDAQGGVSFYRVGVAIFAVAFVGIGIALVALTAIRGGGAVGFVLGVLFVAAGAGRLWLLRRRAT
jgi:hypothetical protein